MTSTETSPTNKYDKIRLRILVTICFGVMLTTLIGIFISRSIVLHSIEDLNILLMDTSQAIYQQSIKDETETLSCAITLLRRNKVLQNLFLAENRAELMTQSQDLFSELRKKYRITHFYYHTITGQNFLRVHEPNRHGDQINRFTMQKAMTSGKLASGIELGPLGTFTLRVVVPWLRDGKIIGYMELGEEIDHIARKISRIAMVDLILLLHKENISEQGWLRGQQLMARSAEWNYLKEYALLNTSFTTIPPEINTYLQTTIGTEDIKTDSVVQIPPTHMANFKVLQDIGGNELGYFVTIIDVSHATHGLMVASVRYVIYSSILLVFLMICYWAYLGKIEKTIFTGKGLLLETEKNFNRVFYNTKDAISIIKNQQFINCNDAFVKMIGATNQDEVLNINPSAISPDLQPDGQLSKDKELILFKLAEEEEFIRFEWLHRKISGEVFPVEVSLTTMWNCGELEFHCLWKDISDQKQHEQNLQKAANDAMALSHSKDEFLANMSHEIRTPMNGIIGLTRLTLDTDLATKQRQMLGDVLYSAEALLGLLNDILDFSKIEAGQLSLESHSFCLETMLDNLISTLIFQAQEKQLSLKNITDDKNLPEFIKSDELRLRQIIINLVGNGLKFTQTGGVTIKVEVAEQNENDFILHFEIQDSGIGIPLEKQDKIFSSFTQADASTSRVFGGTGLGLSITKQLVKLMGGKIWVESEKNQGATFHFTIKAQYGNVEKSSNAQQENILPLKSLRVLLVEDNRINRQIATTVLEEQGHHVKTAEHGVKALEILLTESFDVIFMDVQMPVMDGLATTAIIRNCEEKLASGNDEIAAIEEKLIIKLAGKQTPIIAMTANAMSGDRQKCLDVGMNEYLTKPFIPEQVHNVLHLLFHNTKIVPTKNLVQRTEANTLEETSVEPLSQQAVNHLKSAYGMDENTAKEMIKEAIPPLADTVDDIAEALEKKEYLTLHTAAHSTKGVLLNMGLKLLAEQAEAIETNAQNGTGNEEECTSFITEVRFLITDAQELY